MIAFDFLSFSTNTADKVIFCHDKKDIFLSQIQDQIFLLASKLVNYSQKNIALYCDDIYHFCIAFFACLITDRTTILLPNNTIGVKKELKDHYDAFLTFDVSKNSFTLDGQTIILTEKNNVTQSKIRMTTISIDDLQQKEIIFFSSGSTGTPKKITKQFSYVLNEVIVLENIFGQYTAKLSTFSSVSHQHLYGFIFSFLWPLLTCKKIYTKLIRYPEELQFNLKYKEKFTFITSPTLLSRLDFSEKLNNIICFIAGSLLKTDIAQKVKQNLQLEPFEILGSSETGIIAWRQQLKNERWHCFDSVLLHHNFENLLAVSSNFFPEKILSTGDKIQYLNDKEFILLGRSDRIVKIEGKRLSLTELENKLKLHHWIEDCYALNLHKNRDYIGIFIVLSLVGKSQKLNQSAHIFHSQLRAHLKQWFENILLPRAFRYGNEIPLNQQGKVDKDAIAKLF